MTVALNSVKDGQETLARRNALIERNLPLSLWMAKRFIAMRPDLRQEILSAASLGLIEAASAYDAGRGASFSSLAAVCMRRKIRRELWNQKRQSDRFATLADPGELADPGTPDELAESESAWEILRRLPKKCREAARLVAIEGLTYREAGVSMGCSHTYIGFLLRDSRRFLGDYACPRELLEGA